MFLGAGTNIILDPIFIYVLDWGMEGAALATIISQTFSFIWVVSYFIGKKSKVKLSLKALKPEWTVIKLIITLGIPPFTLQIASSLLNVILNKTLIAHGGDLGISAMGIVHSLQTLLILPVIGINQGVQPLISFNFGARQYDRVREAAKLGIFSATLVIMVGIGHPSLPCCHGGMFNREPELLELGTSPRSEVPLHPLVGFQIMQEAFQPSSRAKSP
jgi:Na+-driven multidrug efflux pump